VRADRPRCPDRDRLPAGTRDGEGAYTFDERVQRGVELVARTLALPIERLLVRGGAAPTTLSPRLATEGGAPADDPFGAVLGKPPAISEPIAYLRLAAPLDVSILLTGPSGSGKTLLANAIHLASRRCHEPFVELNCATLPEALLENE